MIDIHIYLCFSCIWQHCFCLTILDICDVNILSLINFLWTHIMTWSSWNIFISYKVLSVLSFHYPAWWQCCEKKPSACEEEICRSPPKKKKFAKVQEKSPSTNFEENCRPLPLIYKKIRRRIVRIFQFFVLNIVSSRLSALQHTNVP